MAGGEVAGQERGREQAEGGQEHLAGEEEPRGQRAEQGEHGGGQVAAEIPDGVHGQHGEQGGEGEVQPGDALRDERTEQGAGDRAADPVHVQEQLEAHDAPAGPGAGPLPGGQRVRLVAQGEGAVRLADAAGYPVQGEGQRVEDVPDVHHERGHPDRRQRGRGGDQPDEQELERAAERQRRGQPRPPPLEARLRHQCPEGEPDRDETQPRAHGIPERRESLGRERPGSGGGRRGGRGPRGIRGDGGDGRARVHGEILGRIPPYLVAYRSSIMRP